MMKRLSSLLFVVVLILLAISTFLSGCDDDNGYQIFTVGDTSEYRAITIEKGIALFSFEYSGYYSHKDGLAVYFDPDWTSVKLLAPMKQISAIAPNPDLKGRTVSMSYTPAYMDVFVYDASDRGGTAIGDLESRLENEYLGVALDRSQIMVSGVLAECVAYSVGSLIPLSPASEGDMPEKYGWVVYFDHAGLIWRIEAESEVAMADQVQADFEHILQTFKILD